MSALLLGSLLSGGLGLAKSVIGGIQAAKGKKELNQLLANRPQYNIPESYTKALGIYQNLATGEMPGLKRSEQLVGESTARTMTGAERGAISSTAYAGSVASAQDKELQAIQNLAQMNAQWSQQQKQNLAGAYNQYGQLQDQQFEYNVNQPWQIKANMASEKAGVGMTNLFSGLGDMSSAVQNFVGTKYYTDMLAGLQGNGVNKTNPIPKTSYPIGTTPQGNLNATLSDMSKNLQINYPQ